jgi:hypothetical protein
VVSFLGPLPICFTGLTERPAHAAFFDVDPDQESNGAGHDAAWREPYGMRLSSKRALGA